jgi:tubulin--tyrosine ligase
MYGKAEPEIVCNHIPSNYIIGSKKALFLLLHWYYENIMKIDPFTYLPKTYNIKSGEISSPAFQKFLKSESDKPDRVWIVKPGENTNRGNGINVASFS